ncbi:DNA repair protein RadC [Pelomonas sp. V22]|uniref:RadC family protein n=1 Tax=Pelomonas sp. V22 TaxID=2822139 RepID=UPI0024A9F26D|nr:DNA repair protein RadC [Pelomonas sp. V22]MDI4633697.1 DNA repair protein RadC [Pelomonas sp. V22]
MPLDQLPKEARPREKLLARGAASLADAELLALLLRTGIKGRPVLQMAQDLLDEFGGWPGLLGADLPALAKVKGLGPAKRAEIAAVLEIARRSLRSELQQRPVFDAPERVKQYCRLHLGELGHEVFAVLFLDVQHRLIAMETLFRGTLSQTAVYPREIAKRALELGASAVILAHNHPSGVAEPSRADELLTQGLQKTLGLLDVRVLDHLVVSASEVVSFAERGLL